VKVEETLSADKGFVRGESIEGLKEASRGMKVRRVRGGVEV
jgi:hypothetical protein